MSEPEMQETQQSLWLLGHLQEDKGDKLEDWELVWFFGANFLYSRHVLYEKSSFCRLGGNLVPWPRWDEKTFDAFCRVVGSQGFWDLFLRRGANSLRMHFDLAGELVFGGGASSVFRFSLTSKESIEFTYLEGPNAHIIALPVGLYRQVHTRIAHVLKLRAKHAASA